jgi:hypothetical protein
LYGFSPTIHEELAGIALFQRMMRYALIGKVICKILNSEFLGMHDE